MCCVFLLITFYCHKYLEERTTNAGTRANPPFFSYAHSKSCVWRWPHFQDIEILPNFKPKLLDLRVLRFFLLNRFYCHKYLEERSTNAGMRANPPYLSYARSGGGLWHWPHVQGIAILPNFKTKLLDLRVLRFFLNTFYCNKYLEEGLTNAGTRANPPFLRYARSEGGL